MISGYGPVLCFSGHKKHSANANTPSALLSRYNCVVEREFISGSSQGLCSALTVNMIKIVCGRGDLRLLDGQHVLMGHHCFGFLCEA